MARSSTVRARIICAATLSLCAARGWAVPLRIPVSIEEPVGIARVAAPVTIGVPLPAGRVHDGDPLWVADPAGRPVPSQSRVLVRWPDGSSRWALIDCLASVDAHATALYTVRSGRPPSEPRAPAVRVVDAGPDWRVETGGVELTIPRAAPTLLRSVRLGNGPAQPLGVGYGATIDAERENQSVTSATALTETSGPVRTEFLLTGRDAHDLAYEARVAVLAGIPGLRVRLTVTSLSTHAYTRITSLPITVEGGLSAGLVGIAGTARHFVPLDGPHVFRQLDAHHAELDQRPVEGAGDGWARGTGDILAVTLVRNVFAEEWPQAFTFDARALGVRLLDGMSDPVELGIGAAKTFELWLVFQDRDHTSDPARLAATLQHPLVGHVDAAWTAGTGALRNAVDPATPAVHEMLPRLAVAIGRYLARNRAERWDDGPPVACDERTTEHERVGTYGALNWGDWNFPGYRDRSEGCDAWGNLEYDLTQVLGLDFAATGSRVSWDAFGAAARHYRDVDVLHFAPGREDLVGINHPHKVKHFAIESPNTVDLGHTWLEGLATHYALTGEVRSLEAVRGIADVLVRRRYKAGNPRQYGWPMIALAAAYDTTGDPRYREAALSYADAAIAVHQPTPAAGDWKMGILADGIASVHAITGEPRLRDWLVRYADAFVAEVARFADPRYALPLGYLAHLTGSPRYRDDALATVDHMPFGDWGKTLAISGRTAFRILGALTPTANTAAGAIATPVRAAPRRPSASAPPPRSRSRSTPAPRSAR